MAAWKPAHDSFPPLISDAFESLLSITNFNFGPELGVREIDFHQPQ